MKTPLCLVLALVAGVISCSGVSTSDIGNAQAISSPLSVEFSDVAIVAGDAPMTLTLKLDDELVKKAIAEGKAIYAKVKIEGDSLSADTGSDGDPTWIPMLGDVDRDQNTITLNLLASASIIHAVAVVGNELRIAAPMMPSVNTSKASKSAKKTSAKKATAKFDILGQHKWIVICEKSGLSDDGEASCNTLSKSPLLNLRDQLESYSIQLRDQGLNTVFVSHTTIKAIIKSNL